MKVMIQYDNFVLSTLYFESSQNRAQVGNFSIALLCQQHYSSGGKHLIQQYSMHQNLGISTGHNLTQTFYFDLSTLALTSLALYLNLAKYSQLFQQQNMFSPLLHLNLANELGNATG
jgi:hypothetical protein